MRKPTIMPPFYHILVYAQTRAVVFEGKEMGREDANLAGKMGR